MAKIKLTREEFDALPVTSKAARVLAVGVITAALTALFAHSVTPAEAPKAAPAAQTQVSPGADLG